VPQCHAPGQSDGDVSRVPMFVIGAAAPLVAGDANIVAPKAGSAAPAPSDVAVAAAEWKRVETSTDARPLRSFARQFPGYYGEMAMDRAAELEQAAATAERARVESARQASAERERRHDDTFAAAQQAASVEAFEKFLSDFPTSPYATEVRDNLPALRAHEAQAAEAWADVRASTHADRLEQFARHFPGKFAAQARQRIKSLKAASALAPGHEFREGVDYPIMVVVPAGTFTMGSPATEKEHLPAEGPQHEVRIARPFAIGKFPVTVDEFKAFVTATGRDTGSEAWVWTGEKWDKQKGRSWRDPGFSQTGTHPACCLNGDDAQAYVKWMSGKTGKAYRLLSEAEWEYAARGRTEPGAYPRYFFGDSEADLCRYANGPDHTAKAEIPGAANWTVAPCSDRYAYTSPVGIFLPNAFGLYDMAGNVWEWCEDCWHDNYEGAPTDGSAWLQGGDESKRVGRGGSWRAPQTRLRSACRLPGTVVNRFNYVGFRVARAFVPPRTL
jgi:formylglycine-generating enzyme required for sulfatase activity